jgi:DNA-binding NtrC family response regulator
MPEGSIFVVGSNAEITSSLASELREKDLGDVTIMESAEEAFKHLDMRQVRAIICDVEPPAEGDIDGFQFCLLVKSSENAQFNQIPVVLYSTGRKDIQFEQLAKDVAAALFLHLPEQQESLVKALQKLMEDSSAPATSEMLGRILIVEDEEDMLLALRTALLTEKYDVIDARDGEEAIRKVELHEPRVVLLDYRIPKKDGLSVLRWIKANRPATVVVMMTAYGSEVLAVDLMKAGADDYLRKPFDIDDMIAVTATAMRKHGIRLVDMQFRETLSEIESLRSQVKTRYAFENIVGRSSAMMEVYELVRKVAPTEANVLITGESGTGKELVARAIHANSRRAERAFVPVDCASLSESLLESEIFGHEKGAFTGAHRTRPGLLEFATGGTFFMDEVGKMPLSIQSKFLRVLQEKSLRRVGGNEQLPVDVRVVAATNLDIGKAVKEDRFREDLYYRLNVVRIHLPPLRGRREDIPLLAAHFLKQFSQETPRPVEGISAEAMSLLESYNWPGNVRELENVIERAVFLSETPTISRESFPAHIRSRVVRQIPETDTTASFKDAKSHWVDAFERKYLADLLRRHNGNITLAAREAGINRKTIHRLIAKHGLTKP